MTKGERNGWGVMVISAVILLVGTGFAIETLWFLRTAVAVEGRVIGNRQQNGKAGVSHVPSIAFRDAAGREREFESSHSVETPFPIGHRLAVLYSARNPEYARLGGEFLWKWSQGAALIALYFFLCGAGLVFLSRRLVQWGVPMRT
jgi:hypothetical protein